VPARARFGSQPQRAGEVFGAFKIDLIIREHRPFSREELGRCQAAELLPGKEVVMASAEDAILLLRPGALASLTRSG
jgi:hypothetical protein